MKAFILNLERAVKRRKHILRELKKCKLDYELIKGIDGKQLSEDELERLCDLGAVKARPHKLAIGALGCALSHLAAYEKILAEDLDMALVLEDDAILPKNIVHLLERIKENIEINEVVLLHYFMPGTNVSVLSNRKATLLSGNYNLMYPVEFPAGGTAYVITREAARTLSKIKLPINAEADDWGYFYRNGGVQSVRCVHPIVVKITYAETQIQPYDYEKLPLKWKITTTIHERRIPVLHQLLTGYRKFRDNMKPEQRVEVVDEPSLVPNERV